jgi:hypothetical protein
MTHSEREGVRFLEFSELWTELWNGFSKSKNKDECENARCKFASLREGVHVKGKLCSIATLVGDINMLINGFDKLLNISK